MSKTIYVIGLTCSGKDYFIERAVELYPEVFAAVQVGKELRKRYSPEYFKGSGAPEHTEEEALNIFKEQWSIANNNGAKIILVSGQPRRISQVPIVFTFASGSVLWLYANDATIKERISKRFIDDQPAYHLACERIVNDRIMYYDVLHSLIAYKIPIETFSTDLGTVEALIHAIKEQA